MGWHHSAPLARPPQYPDVFGSILAESPSFWSAKAKFLEDMALHDGRWAERIFLAVGTREFSATRDYDRADLDEKLLEYSHEAKRILEEKGVMSGER